VLPYYGSFHNIHFHNSVIAVGTATLCCCRWNTFTYCVCIALKNHIFTMSAVLDGPFHYSVQSKVVKYRNKTEADFSRYLCVTTFIHMP